MSKKSFVGGLDTLLQETASRIENDSSLQERNNAVKQENNKAVNTASSKATFIENNKAGKEKATFNLSKKLLQELEDTWIKIRKIRGDKKISKTDIVEFSLSQILAGFKALKQESKLHSLIESNKV